MPSSTAADRSNLIDVRNCEVASLSDVGSVRAQNQDFCAAHERKDGARMLILADGMGGHRGGETASRLAVESLAAAFAAAEREGESPFSDAWLGDAIREANRDIYARAEEDPNLRGMGTTIVSVLIDADGRTFVGHVGDSRAYLLRDASLERITEDHSVVAEMHRRGLLTEAETQTHPRRNEILRSVGVDPNVMPETREIVLEPGDELLLCSDGLCGVLHDATIASVLVEGREAGSELENVVAQCIARANDAGGSDNITAQLLRVPKEPLALPAASAEPLGPEQPAGSYAALAMLSVLVAGLAVFAWILWN